MRASPPADTTRWRLFLAALFGYAMIGLAAIAFARALGARDQYSLRSIAAGHYLRGELDQAIAALEEALARGGALQSELEALVERLRREREER